MKVIKKCQLFAVIAMICCGLIFPASALADSITPVTFSAKIKKGGSVSVNRTVTVTREVTSAKADVFFLIDTTGSMEDLIDSAKTKAAEILNNASALGDVAFGVGYYEDFPTGEYGISTDIAYQLVTDITKNTAAVRNGINALSLGHGNDWPESNLYALTQVASSTSWREGATRIIVWFGDAVGHDGDVESDYPSRVGLQDAISALTAKSIIVEAVNVNRIYHRGYYYSMDEGGVIYPRLHGQASAITAATGGKLFDGSNTNTIVSIIGNALKDAFASYSEVKLSLSRQFAGLGVSISPAVITGSFDRSYERYFNFSITYSGLEVGTYPFDILAKVNGGVVATASDVIEVALQDCNGVWNGTAFTDSCGQCVGGNTGKTACVQDCNGVWGGVAYRDECGICVGGNTGNSPCTRDCNGTAGGSAFVDNCGICVGGNTGKSACVQDCSGNWGGSAYSDNCGVCVGGNTGRAACVQDCSGTWGGTAFWDECGQCVGGNTGKNACVITVGFSTEAQEVNEDVTVTATVTLSIRKAADVVVPYTVSGTAESGADHDLSGGTLIIPAGQTGGIITFNVAKDALKESDETVIITLSSPVNAVLGTITRHIVTIHDTSVFIGGVFTVGKTGTVEIDWLYDGGMYEGELGIFSLDGMEELLPDMRAFIAEAARRVLSGTEDGYVVLSDPTEAAHFSGTLGGEPKDWNSGTYNDVKKFKMRRGDLFATVLVPDGNFETLLRNPGTEDALVRPLFSLVSSNPDYGMYLGQVADVNGMGNAFVYEDMSVARSDKDYNDLIIRVSGATIADAPLLDELIAESAAVSRSKRNETEWFDWRTETELGKEIMSHLETGAGVSQSIETQPEKLLMTVTLIPANPAETAADLLVYDAEERVIGKAGGDIPGAVFGVNADGSLSVSLPVLRQSRYRVLARGMKTESATLTVKVYQQDAEIFSETKEIGVKAHQVIVSVVSTDSNLSVDFKTPAVTTDAAGNPLYHDFDGDGDIDDTDVEKVSALWNVSKGDACYDAFYDLDDDGHISVLDIMRVASGMTGN
ncbi:MAG: hypothetical protein BWK80_04495 [Desulfobacteraceae bacterium IS3]|nr:MAG: hypothetical protein BWK80_04495 [Desulfobacteraceae bacterium IS3]